MTASVVPALTSPWPANAGYFRSGNKPLRLIKLTRVHACCVTSGCGESIYSDGGEWRHTRTLDRRCSSGAGWAEPYDPIAVEDEIERLQDKHADDLVAETEQAQEVGYDNGFETGKSEGLEEGHDAGRKEMHAEIDAALQGAINWDAPSVGLRIDDIRDALAAAWNSCAP